MSAGFSGLNSSVSGPTSGCGPDRSVEELACLQHAVHVDRELASNCYGSPFEADLFSQLQFPDPQRTIGRDARQGHCRRFVEQTTQMIVAAS